MTPHEFATKWLGSSATERAAAQEHFIDLCRMLGEMTPNEADPDGDWYAFEKGAAKLEGGDGYADVWKRGHFGWEYKGKKKDLAAAYRQLVGSVNGHGEVATGGHEKSPPQRTAHSVVGGPPPLVRASFIR